MAAVMMVMMTWPLGAAAPGAILSHAETWSQVCIHLPASLHQLIYTTQLHTGIIVLIISNQYQTKKQSVFLGLYMLERTKKVNSMELYKRIENCWSSM